MNETNPVGASPDQTVVPGLLPRQVERWQALVDILYLSQLFAFYVFSALYPFMGLFYGILLLAGGVSPKTKKVGKTCLILGIINLGLCLVIGVGFLVLTLTGVLAGIAANN
jgi:hypothetical protein